MLKSITLAGATIILAAFATTTVQARQIPAGAQRCEQVEAQKTARTHARSPYVWLVLGVGY